MIEVEIKIKIDNKDEIAEKLENLGFVFVRKKFQEDIYFNGIDRDFRETDEALRIRDEDGNFFVTYKGPKIDKISKTREEIEVKIEDKEKMRNAVKECINNQECKVEDNKSHGKYHSQKFEAYVTSEEERNEFFKRLQNHKDIKLIL